MWHNRAYREPPPIFTFYQPEQRALTFISWLLVFLLFCSRWCLERAKQARRCRLAYTGSPVALPHLNFYFICCRLYHFKVHKDLSLSLSLSLFSLPFSSIQFLFFLILRFLSWRIMCTRSYTIVYDHPWTFHAHLLSFIITSNHSSLQSIGINFRTS